MKNVLSQFDCVEVRWIAEKSLRIDGPDGRQVIIHKSNNMKFEVVLWVVEMMGISMAEFEQAYKQMAKN